LAESRSVSRVDSAAHYCEGSIIKRSARSSDEIALPVPLFIVPVLSTLAGGLLALRLRSALGLLIALSTGLLLGATVFDLLPEAVMLERAAGGTILRIALIVLVSFLGFLMAHHLLSAWNNRLSRMSSARTWGRIGGGLLVAHSFRDGMAIGVSYAASHPAGYIVAAGIAAHDIGDGINTVLLSTRGHHPEVTDHLLLIADCLAPLAGILLTAWFHLSNGGAAALLALTAGFFMHMIFDELLPQLGQDHTPRSSLAAAAAVGILVIYVATRLAI
jgi:zinc transporter ZupT